MKLVILELLIMTQYQSVLSAAFALDVSERLQLIDALAATVPDDAPPTLSPEWIAELDRRAHDLETGKATAIPAHEVFESIQRKRDERRGA